MDFKDCFGNEIKAGDSVFYLVKDFDDPTKIYNFKATVKCFREPSSPEDSKLIVLEYFDREKVKSVAYADCHDIAKMDENGNIIF